MLYQSTRSQSKEEVVNFEQAILSGMAPDGGLYVPQIWPKFTQDEWQAMKGLSYHQLAAKLLKPYYEGFFEEKEFQNLAEESYKSFQHKDIAPLNFITPNIALLELFHGPTLAFKDFALQLLARLMANALNKNKKRMTIIGATSGDTGSAAIEAFAGIENINIFILHPHNRVSDVQRRQMTTQMAKNVHNIAIKGSFDDCQDLVKALFADKNFREEQALGAVNSINWGRIMIQIVYYAHAILSLDKHQAQNINIHVPTGNFGNVLAAWIAKQMGLGIDQLTISSNKNDILTRFFQQNDMSMNKVVETLAPSMDIQVSSNFERYLFELLGRDGKACATLMKEFRHAHHLPLENHFWQKAKAEFSAFTLDDSGILSVIKELYDETGMIIDPHSATAYQSAKLNHSMDENGLNIVAATAHPAKFPSAIEQAIGHAPTAPDHIQALFAKEERFDKLDNDEMLLKTYIRDSL